MIKSFFKEKNALKKKEGVFFKKKPLKKEKKFIIRKSQLFGFSGKISGFGGGKERK